MQLGSINRKLFTFVVGSNKVKGEKGEKRLEQKLFANLHTARVLSHLMCATLPTTDEHLIFHIHRVYREEQGSFA